jgi:hypothetical protein
MSTTGNIHLLPPPWDLKRPRQRDGDQTRKSFVQDVAKTTGRTAEANRVCGGEEWEAAQRAQERDPEVLAKVFTQYVAQRTLALPEPSRLPGLRGERKG